MLNKFFAFIFCLFIPFSLLANDYQPKNFWDQYLSDNKNGQNQLTSAGSRSFFKQWFMGPLLVPAPIGAAPNKPAFEPSITAYSYYGNFDNNWKIHKRNITTWSMLYTAYAQVGLNDWLGIDFIANLLSNYNKQANYTHFTDTILRVGYQISEDKHLYGDWTPNCRLIFQEVFPTGKYQKLNPSKGGTDISGQGTFQSGFYLALEKGFKYNTNHAYNLYAALGYFMPTNFKVKKENLYGGNNFTDGKIRPGSIFSIYFSGEVEVSKHISIAFDSNYEQNLAGGFTGNMGIGQPVTVPQMVSFNVAIPEIEVTITENAGIMFGPWFTFAGQNTPSFAAFFVALLVFF